MGRIKYVALLLLLMVSCGKSSNITIKGSFSGLNEKSVYLDRIMVNSSVATDSVITDGKGRFKFKIKASGKNPAFYNLRYGKQGFTLLLSPGDKIKISSLGHYARNYLVKGSHDSELIKEVNLIVGNAFSNLDTLSRKFDITPDYDIGERRRILNEFENVYVKQKQELIRFIVTHPMSLASLYALYQELPNGTPAFNNRDILYLKLVHDSLAVKYPDSPNVLSLKKDIDRIERQSNLGHEISKAMASPTTFPEINLPDMPGNRIKLSSIKDKIILLDFWSTEMPRSVFHNAELTEIYSEFFDKGFEIYQVSLDKSKSAWVSAISEQKLPWISVCDFLGMDSPAAGSYNISSVPSNFLIDMNGNIVARNISLENLPGELRKLLK